MNLTTEQLAELLYGIARSQEAIIDAIESENGGGRNTTSAKGQFQIRQSRGQRV